MVEATSIIKRCPVCGGEPDIGEVEPWPASEGPAPWYAGCYKTTPIEHFVGVNGDDRRETVRLWNAEVEKIAATSFACDGCSEVCTYGYRVEGKMMCTKCRAEYWRRHA